MRKYIFIFVQLIALNTTAQKLKPGNLFFAYELC